MSRRTLFNAAPEANPSAKTVSEPGGVSAYHTEPNGRDETAPGGVVFRKAVRAARKGRYRKALELLQAANERGDCSEAQSLDLEARVYAQQGHYFAAESCWVLALQLHPDNAEIPRALTRLRQERLPSGRAHRFLVATSVLALLVLLLWQVGVQQPRNGRQLQIHEDRLTTLREGQARIEENLQTSERGISAALLKFDRHLAGMEERFSKRLDDLPTADALARNQNELLTQVNSALDHRHNQLHLQIASFAADQLQAGRNQTATLGSIADDLQALHEDLRTMGEELKERQVASNELMYQGIQQASDTLQLQIADISDADRWESLQRDIDQLSERIDELQQTIGELPLSSLPTNGDGPGLR